MSKKNVTKNELSFKYLGKRFIPLKQISNQMSFEKISNCLISDSKLGFNNYKKDDNQIYNYTEFYLASGNSKCDLFRCLDNGKIYIPCSNELFEYANDNIKRTKNKIHVERATKIENLIEQTLKKSNICTISNNFFFEYTRSRKHSICIANDFYFSISNDNSFEYEFCKNATLNDTLMDRYSKMRTIESKILEILNTPYIGIEV